MLTEFQKYNSDGDICNRIHLLIFMSERSPKLTLDCFINHGSL